MAADTRNIPSDVKKQLRKEVNFRCPAPSCESPYLTWHHFDPPWHEKPHHDPARMIALCRHHHDRADAGNYTIDELRTWKRRQSPERIKGVFDRFRSKLKFRLGANTDIEASQILNVDKRPLVWISENEEGFKTVNFDLFSGDGHLICQMRENGWEVMPDIEDLISPARAQNLKISSSKHKVMLDLSFEDSKEQSDTLICFFRCDLEFPCIIIADNAGVRTSFKRASLGLQHISIISPVAIFVDTKRATIEVAASLPPPLRRNDNCTCFTGKKYKHCCGAGL